MRTYARIITATAGLLTLLGGSTVRADFGLRAVVPFEFAAGSTTLAAGAYSIDHSSASRGVLIVRSHRGGVCLLAQMALRAERGSPARLVFHRYGHRYFLRQVWFPGMSGYAMPETREERELATRAGRVASGPERVTVAAGLS